MRPAWRLASLLVDRPEAESQSPESPENLRAGATELHSSVECTAEASNSSARPPESVARHDEILSDLEIGHKDCKSQSWHGTTLQPLQSLQSEAASKHMAPSAV